MRKVRLGEIQLPGVTQLGLRTNSRGLRSSVSFVPFLGQAHGLRRVQGEGSMGGRREQPLALFFSRLGPVRVVCVLFQRPSQASLAMHTVWRQSHIKQIKGLSALQPHSCLAARDGGMILRPSGL